MTANYVCEECGAVFPEDEMIYEDIYGDWYCVSCIDEATASWNVL